MIIAVSERKKSKKESREGDVDLPCRIIRKP